MVNKSIILKTFVASAVAVAVLLMSGCAGASFSKVGEDFSGNKVAVSKKDVHAKTKMSDSVFLEPVAPEDQIVYFRFRSTADEELDVDSKVKAKFEKMGFKVTRNPKEANFMVQVNFLKVGEMDEAEQKGFLNSGFSSGIAGAAALGGISMLGNGSHSGTMAAAGVGLLAGLAFDALQVKDIHFALVTDVEIRQRLADGETGVQNDKAANKQGMSGSNNQSFTNTNVQWKTYRTRIVSSAYGAGLEFDVARPFLEDGMVKAIAGTM